MRSVQTISKSGVSGAKGAVAAARQVSADAAVLMLEAGGNAVDAAVAAAFVAGVVEPMETTLAGSGFMLVGTPQGQAHSIEFGPKAPQAAQATMFTIDEHRDIDRGLGVSMVIDDENVQGIKSAGVPMTLVGLASAHERFGRLPLGKVLAPAIEAASDGFSADPYFALEALEHIDALRMDPGASALFLPDGLPPASAHLGAASLGQPALIRQPALARTLQRIADQGVAAFYEGDVGELFLETHRELGGIVTRKDLVAARPKIVSPRHIRFRDTEVFAPWSPCGAITELQMLNVWQALYPDQPPQGDDAERLGALAQTSWHAFADRYHWIGDPDFVAVPEEGLLSAGYARHVAQLIRDGAAPPRSVTSGETPWNYFARVAAHDPWVYDSRESKGTSWSPGGATEPPSGTTHVSVTDDTGMTASITHTAANHCGGKVVCPRTGLLLDATMGWFNARPGAANSIAGGKRPLANMGPVLLMRNGQPYVALGAPGGRRIINAVVQIILNLVERDMSVADSLLAPRIDASGATILLSERLAHFAPSLECAWGPVALVSEQHQGYGYELARPNLSMYGNGTAYAAADPFSKAFARAVA